mgnify:CR=1 FL=1|jgi:hypothetical protein
MVSIIKLVRKHILKEKSLVSALFKDCLTGHSQLEDEYDECYIPVEKCIALDILEEAQKELSKIL